MRKDLSPETPLPEGRWEVEHFREVVSSFQDPKELLRWAYFTTPRTAISDDRFELWRAIALHARALDAELLRVVTRVGWCPEALLENPHVTGEHLQLVLESLTAEMEEWAAEEGPAAASRRVTATAGLVAFSRAGVLTKESAHGQRLLALAGRKNGNVESGLAEVLLTLPDLEARHLAWIAELPQQRFREAAARHPNADVRVWAQFLARGRDSDLEFLSGLPAARAHPVLRYTLLAHGQRDSEEILFRLAEDRVPGEFPGLLDSVRAHGGRWAVQLLETASPEQLAELREEDLRPLLTSEQAEVRLAAIRAFRPATSVGPSREPASSTPSSRRPTP